MMAATIRKRVFSVLTLLTLTHIPLLSSAVEFRGMEENCILSFVVPRDKVKSSCDMEQRVTRRLNAMETKVTLYKQHVQELQEQLSKEREFHRQRMEEINQQLAQRDPSAHEALIQKRMQMLEEELRKVRVTVASSTRPASSSGMGEKPHGRGASLGNVPSGRSREEEEKAISTLVKNIVHTEVKKLFDNYTHYVGRYVHDQVLAFNQIMNMVPRSHQPFPDTNLPPKWPDNKLDRNEVERQPTVQPGSREAQLLNELEGIRSRLNTTGERLADHVHNVLNKANITTPAPSTSNKESTIPSQTNRHPKDLLDVTDSASGDLNDTSSDNNNNPLTFTQVNNNTASTDSGPQSHLHVTSSAELGSLSGSSKENAAAAKSRMSNNADLNKLPEPSERSGDGQDGQETTSSNVSGWEESMVHDQSRSQWIQTLLRTEMQRLLQQQVEEVVGLVSKTVDNKLSDHETKFSQLEQRLAADIKHLDQVVNGLRLEMTSVSQGLQTVYSRTDSLGELQDTVQDIKKNMSTEGGSRLFATLLDEQGKKVRKMERLTDIYKQSLEHYRNETKLEYRDLKDRLSKESTVLRGLQADLYHNVTSHALQLSHTVNTTASRQREEIKQRVQVMEDNSLLLQIDLSSFERQLKSKTSKSERDINKLTDDVNDLQQKTRNLQKTLNAASDRQSELSSNVNETRHKVHNLEMEIKLNVLDEWLPFEFDYMKTRTDCFGKQYIRKSGFKTGRFVGVVLCTNTRYKIFLGQSLTDTFKNIGDDSGMGEDHCQFVNARSMSKVKVSPFRTSTETEPGYVRTHWGQEPRPELLNIIRPSPAWYECGVTIP